MGSKNRDYTSYATSGPSVRIKRNIDGDTRSAKTLPETFEVKQANESHIKDVSRVMEYIAGLLMTIGYNHDYTKIDDFQDFYENMKYTMVYGGDFKKGKWFKHHVTSERHHPNDYCHDDINLFDLIEMCADVTCAAKARSGKSPKNVKISNEILRKAFYNTIKFIDNITYIEGGGNV